MSSHIIDSEVHQDAWSTEETRHIFDTRTRFQRWLDIEVALARAQGRLGVIPEEAAREIAKNADMDRIDMAQLKADFALTQHSLMPLLKAVQRLCPGDTGEYIHFGPTTQDIEDTGGILEIKDAYHVMLRDMREIEDILMDLARKHRETVMCGRTHSQQGLPITLGLKLAIWISEIRRHIERFKQMAPRLFVGMLHGGAGSMSALGPKAMETMELMMTDLGLGVPDVGWGNSRDILAEYVCNVANAAATFGKIANEIFQLGKTELGEMSEPLPEAYIGSSTMPHKRNPEICEFVVMLSRIIRSHAGVALEAVVCEHERDTRSWRTDWLTLPECSMMMGAILKMMKTLLADLGIHEERIAQNLDLLKGLMLSEAYMFLLGEKIGKQTAHHVVGKAALAAMRENRHLKETLMDIPEVRAVISAEELEEISDYRRHIGFAREMVDKVCETSERLRPTDPDFLK